MQPQPCIFVHGFCGSEDQCRRLRLAPTHERDELLSDEDEKFLLPPSCILVHGCGPRTSVGGCATREPSNETSFCPTGREVLVAAVVLRARLRPEDQCRGLRHARTLERDELLSDEDEKLLLPPSCIFVHSYCGLETCRELRLATTLDRDELLSDDDGKLLLLSSCIIMHGRQGGPSLAATPISVGPLYHRTGCKAHGPTLPFRSSAPATPLSLEKILRVPGAARSTLRSSAAHHRQHVTAWLAAIS